LERPREFLPKQIETFEAIKTFKYVLYSGAFGAGKTLLLSHIIITTCMNFPKTLFFVGSQTVPMLRDTVVRTVLEEIDLYQDKLDEAKIDLKIEKAWRPSTMSYKFYNDAEILFRSCDEPSKFKSLNLDAFALDEPVDIDEQVFLMLQGRLRANHCGHRFGVMAGNPAGKMNWVYQRFFDHPTDDYYRVHTKTKDNTFLPSDYIRSMYEAYDYEYARRYLEGEWGSFVGQVYRDFNMDKHVGDYKDKKYKYYIGGYDDGYRNPACFLTIGIDSDNKVYILNEYYVKEKTTPQIVDHIASLDYKYRFHKIFADPSATNFIQTAKHEKLRVVEADNDIDKGISKCKAFFANDIIYIDKSCKNLIKEVESYAYDKDRLLANLSEKPRKIDDHAVDAMRYAFTEHNPWKQHRTLIGGKW